MMYLDNGATTLDKPLCVRKAVMDAMVNCANPGRGGYPQALAASRIVFRCREEAARLFHCQAEQVVFTGNCTHGLNMAIRTLVKPGDRVVISGFEHNAVVRPLHLLRADVAVAGCKLFDWTDTLEQFEGALKKGAKAAVFTHISNVFGYILPVEELAALCRKYGVPFIIDAAQSAGSLPVHLKELGADFIAMPGHKGLLGPQGTGILLCGRMPEPLLAGGTGSDSRRKDMPQYLPDVGEAGTLNVPGIAGLEAALRYIQSVGIQEVYKHEHRALLRAVEDLKTLGVCVFSGDHQAATVSFVPSMDCETMAKYLAERGIAVRAGLHCAPLAHESAGTLETGTVRISFGPYASREQNRQLKWAIRAILTGCS